MEEPKLIAPQYVVPPLASVTAPEPTPDAPPWNTPLALGTWFVSVLLILLLPNLAVIPYALSQKIDLTSSQRVMDFLLSDPTAVLLNIGAVIPAHLITILLAWAVVTRFWKYSFSKMLGWRLGGMRWWLFVLIPVLFFGLAAIVGYFVPEQENDLTRILKSSRAAVFLVAFLATFTAPIVEEVIYRGLVYSALQRTAGATLGIVATTILFAVVHVPQYYPSYSTILLILLLSLTLTLVRARTGNLLPCIILHFIFNGIQSVALVVDQFLPKAPIDIPDASAFLHRLL